MFDIRIDRYRIRPDNGHTYRLDRYTDIDTCKAAQASKVGERSPQPSWSVYPGSFDRCLKRLHDDWRTQVEQPRVEVDGDLDDVLERINDAWMQWEKWWVAERSRLGPQLDALRKQLEAING